MTRYSFIPDMTRPHRAFKIMLCTIGYVFLPLIWFIGQNMQYLYGLKISSGLRMMPGLHKWLSVTENFIGMLLLSTIPYPGLPSEWRLLPTPPAHSMMRANRPLSPMI